MSDAVGTFRDTVALLASVARSSQTKSITEHVRSSIIEPTVLLDQRVAISDYSDSIMSATLNFIATYYVHGVTLMGDVGGIKIESVLDSLNPNRSPIIAAGGSVDVVGKILSMESEGDVITTGVNARSIESFNESSNLSVGNSYAVDMTFNGSSVTIPLTVRLRTVVGNSTNIRGALTVGKEKKSFTDVYYALSSGQLSFIRDVIFAEDDVAQHRKNLKNDTTGMYRQNLKRDRTNKLSSILSLKPSIGTASNIYVISEETANELRVDLRGDLSSVKIREKLFKDTFGTLLVVVSDADRTITFYPRGSERGMTVSIKELIRKKGSGGIDMVDLLSILNKGGL